MSGYDAIKHSQSNTQVRETVEQWKSFCKEINSALKPAAWGGKSRKPTYEELEAWHLKVGSLCRKMIEVLEAINWPQWDRSCTRLSDEKAFEQAHRHLQATNYLHSDAGLELAWGLAISALIKYETYKDHDTYKELGINLDAYFRAELIATLEVLEKHHRQVTLCNPDEVKA